VRLRIKVKSVNFGIRTTLLAPALGALLLAVGAAGNASASVVLNFSNNLAADTPQQIDFSGISDDYMNHTTPIPGLTAVLKLTLVSVSGGSTAAGDTTWKFNYTVINSSTSPVTTSRVSEFGFDTASTSTLKTSSVSGTGPFGYHGSGNFPIAGNRQICFKGQNNGNCAGGGGTGVNKGGSPQSGTFTLVFNNKIKNLSLEDLVIRWQNISTSSRQNCLNNSSGIGYATSSESTPEPSTWAMLLVGFGGLGAMIRSRRKKTQVLGA
jgi:hypothetical protein